MGTEVLQPHDLLVERFHVPPPSFHRRRNVSASLIVNRRQNYNAGYKRTSPKPDKKKSNETKKVTQGGAGKARRKDDRGGGGAGQVMLLRRGESLDSLTAKINGGGSPNSNSKFPKQKPADDLAMLGAGRIGPDSPGMVPKQIRLSRPPLADVYAGSAFSKSPSPRSLPLPSFFNKKQQDDATRDLRRLLRLD